MGIPMVVGGRVCAWHDGKVSLPRRAQRGGLALGASGRSAVSTRRSMECAEVLSFVVGSLFFYIGRAAAI